MGNILQNHVECTCEEFALEKARVRTFRLLENIFALCMFAYVFMIGHIKRSKRFKRIVIGPDLIAEWKAKNGKK